jgi:aryl-alcohol dehydrogenase-like predicted oxidoreductase
VAALQSELSLWTRDAIEGGTLQWCAEHGAAFVAFCPLGRGFLTGTVQAGSFGADDTRASKPRFAPEAMAANRSLVDRVLAIAEEAGATPAQVALAWTLAQGEHVLPIPGTRRQERLEENASAARVQLDAATLAALDDLPPAVGDRYPASRSAG